MNNEGWVCIYRQLAEHPLWTDKPFSKGQAWIDLIMMANYKSNRTVFDGKLTTISKGSRITSIRYLAERWGWSNTKVVTFFNLLETEKMIVRKSDTKKTVVTIVNYSKYQDRQDTKATQTRHRNAAETPQKRTNNKENKENKDTRASALLAQAERDGKPINGREVPLDLIDEYKARGYDNLDADEKKIWGIYMRR